MHVDIHHNYMYLVKLLLQSDYLCDFSHIVFMIHRLHVLILLIIAILPIILLLVLLAASLHPLERSLRVHSILCSASSSVTFTLSFPLLPHP